MAEKKKTGLQQTNMPRSVTSVTAVGPDPDDEEISGYPNYQNFVQQLKAAVTASGQGEALSSTSDDDLVRGFYSTLDQHGKEKFFYRYGYDAPQDLKPIFVKEGGTPPKRVESFGKQIMDTGRKVKNFANSPLDQGAAAKGGEKLGQDIWSRPANLNELVAGQGGRKELYPRSLPIPIPYAPDIDLGRDTLASLAGNVPGFGPALQNIISPEMMGEAASAQTTPINAVLNATGGLRAAGVLPRASAIADIGASYAQGLSGLYQVLDPQASRGQRLAGAQQLAFSIPGVSQRIPQRSLGPQPPPLQDAINRQAAQQFFPEPSLPPPMSEPMARDVLLGPSPQPPPQKLLPPIGGTNPTFEAPPSSLGRPSIPGQMPPGVATPHFGNNPFDSLPSPTPVGIAASTRELQLPQELVLAAEQRAYPSVPPNEFGQQAFPGMNHPLAPGPLLAPELPSPVEGQRLLFPQASLPNFPPKNWTYSGTNQIYRPGGTPPKVKPLEAGGKKTLSIKLKDDRGAADLETLRLISNFSSAGIGGLTGAVMDPDDPLTGALIGVGAGWGLGRLMTTPLGIRAKKEFDRLMTASAQAGNQKAKDYIFERDMRDIIRKAPDDLQANRLKSFFLNSLPKDEKVRAAALARVESPSGAKDWWKWSNTYMKGQMLSSAKALTTQLFNFPALALRNFAVDPARVASSELRGTGSASKLALLNSAGQSFGEVSPYFRAGFAGTATGLKDAYNVLRFGISDEVAENLKAAIPLKPGTTHTPFDIPHSELHKMDIPVELRALGWTADITHRIVNALDVFPRAIARAQAEAMQSVTAAVAEGSQKGLKGRALNGYVAKNYANRVLTPGAKDEAQRRALEVVLQEDPDAITRRVIQSKMDHPVVDTLVPFAKTLGNAFRQSLEMVPGVGVVVHKSYHKNLNKGVYTEALRDEMYAKQAVGMLLMAGLASADLTGRITITGPEAQGVGERIREKQFTQPFSVGINGPDGKPKFLINYTKFPAISALFAAYAGVRDTVQRVGDGEEAVTSMLNGARDLFKFGVDASVLRLYRDTIDLVTGYSNEPTERASNKRLINSLARLSQSYIPFSGAQRSVFEKGLDNTVRKQEDPAEVGATGVWASQLPWNYSKREPVLTWDGRPVTRPGGPVGRVLDPVDTFVPPDGITKRIQKMVGDEAVPGSIDTQKDLVVGEAQNKRVIDLSRDEQFRMKEEVGKRRGKKISELTRSEAFKKAKKPERGKMIKEASRAATKEVHEEWKQKLSKKR